MKTSKFVRLRSMLNKKWFTGRMIRWMIEDSSGRNTYCIHCGNMANGVINVKYDKRAYNIPLCNSHAAELKEPPESAPFHVEIDRTKKINKSAILPFNEWLSKNNKEFK